MLPAQDEMSFVGPDVEWFALSPAIALVAGALLLLVVGALTPAWPRRLYAGVTVVVAGVAAALAMFNWDDITDSGGAGGTLVADALAFDRFALFVTIALCAAVALAALITDDYLEREGYQGPEVYALYLVAATGGVVMGAANDLIVLFIGLETLSLALYVLAASNRRRSRSGEAGLKYFILGGFSSAFFLYGAALIYGAIGSTNFSRIADAMGDTVLIGGNDSLALAGVALLMVGLAFKVAAAPFHVWTPDVYQGAPSPVTGFMASVGKVAAFAAVLRVLVSGLPFYRDDWRPVIWVLAVASLLVGSFLAVVQTNVKRMLAYSSISHAGFMLVGVEAAGATVGAEGEGVSSTLVYLFAYAVIVAGTFGVVSLVGRASDGDTSLDAFRGLGRRRPVLALALTVFLIAQAGVPFTSGFVAKFGVIRAAIEERSYALAIIAMVSSVVAAYLYLRIMVSTWMTDEESSEDAETFAVPFTSGLAIGAAAVFTLAVGILPGWLIDAAQVAGTLR
ncbi:MAG: NADH-quinone oxidoreductase subunit N [Desertimonas sp.]